MWYHNMTARCGTQKHHDRNVQRKCISGCLGCTKNVLLPYKVVSGADPDVLRCSAWIPAGG